MLIKMNRQCNQVDASPGGGAAPAQEPAKPTDAAPAQGNSADDMMAAFEAKMELWRNGVFAAARKMVDDKLASVSKQTKRNDASKDDPPATTSHSQDPSEVFMRLRSLDRAVMATGSVLTERQLARIERDFKAESPDDVSAWVRSYLDDLGIQKPAPAAAASLNPNDQPKPPAQPRTAIPASGGAAPPPPRADVTDLDILSMSKDDVNSFIQTHGLAKYNEQLRKQLKGRPVRTRG